MKVIKPMMLGLLWRAYRRNGHRLSVTGTVCFPFATPDRPLTEQAMWTHLGAECPKDTVWDAGIPKDRGELLLSAHGFAPGGIPVEFRRIFVQVGPLRKEIDLYGDRLWHKRNGEWIQSRPEPFRTMLIDYTRSFGGKNNPQNPTGKGFSMDPEESPVALPNIESPLYPTVSPQSNTPPAGLGPLDITWSERRSRTGQYQPGEIGTAPSSPPALPANADWTLYNQAPSDQWLTGFWEGRESYLLEGLHPEYDRQSGRLPDIRIRAFATLDESRNRSFIEIPMHPETVWLFPHLEIGVVIHRGSMAIETDDASDVASLLLAAEDPGENRPESHYLHYRNRRDLRSPEDLSLYGDGPLLPRRLEDDPQANIGNVQYHMAHQSDEIGQRTKRILSKKLEKARTPTEPPPAGESSSRVGEARSSLEQTIGSIQKELGNPSSESPFQPGQFQTDELKKQMDQKIREALSRIPDNLLSKANLTREGILSAKAPMAPLKQDLENALSGTALKERLSSIAASLPEANWTNTSLRSGNGAFEAAAGQVEEKISALSDKIDTLVRSVHLFAPPPKDRPHAGKGRQKVLEQLKTTRNFRKWSLRGADLSGLDLSGCDFSESDLIGCDFSESDLTRSRFQGAWASHGCFLQSKLSGSVWDGANLGHAEMKGVRAIGASFEKTVLSGATFEDCLLENSRFDGADLSNTSFARTRAKGCSFPGARFMRIEGTLSQSASQSSSRASGQSERTLFRDVDFSGSNLEKALFMKCDFLAVDFSGCQLSGATFLDCCGPSTIFKKSILAKGVFVQSIQFAGSSFGSADLSGANLRGVDLSGSDFRGAILQGTDGSGGNWQHTNLSGARAIGARFQKADLRWADGRWGDFRQAVFLNADLRFANFSGSSLYKACVTGAQIDDSTLFDHALLGKTTITPGGNP
ncbi:MAG: DUF2169 family type VI secretion system accessory protein [Leptospirillum sp.]